MRSKFWDWLEEHDLPAFFRKGFLVLLLVLVLVAGVYQICQDLYYIFNFIFYGRE